MLSSVRQTPQASGMLSAAQASATTAGNVAVPVPVGDLERPFNC